MKVGALWVYLQGGLGAVIQFGAGIVLARILDPADFGAFYAVVAFTAILQAQVLFGIPAALLQAKELTEDQWNSAFWVMEAISVGCTIMVFAFSGWLQGFYDDLRFTLIIHVMCLNFFIIPYMSINGTLLRRNLDYKIVSQIQIVVAFVGIAVSIGLAVAGFGPFSLAISGILSSLLSTVLMARKAPWRPSLLFNRFGLKPLFRFGWRLHLNNSLSLFAGRVDNMMVGSMIGAVGLGIYNRAFNLSRMPVTEITSRMYQVFFTGLSRVQDDLEYSRAMYSKILCAMTTAVFPFLAVFILDAEGIIGILYGVQWLPAAVPLKIMALGSFPYVIAVTLGALSDAQNLVARETPIQVFNAAATILAVLLGTPWGLIGISIGISVKSFLLMLLLNRMVSRSHVGLKFKYVLKAAGPAVISTMMALVIGGLAGWRLRSWFPPESFVHLCGVASAVFGTYGASLALLARLMPDNEGLRFIKELLTSTGVRLWRRIIHATPVRRES